MNSNQTGLLDYAVQRGSLTRDQIEQARLVRALGGGGRSTTNVLVEEGFIDPDRLAGLKVDHEKELLSRLPDEVRQALETPEARIGPFVRIALIGRGGLGEVWRGYDLRLSRYVAIKFPHARRLREVLDEARVLAQLDHPGIVPVHEIGPDYIVMGYVEGVTPDKAGLTPLESLEVVRQVAIALDVAHRQGFVHADMKPANILVTRNPLHAVAVDFGIAHPLSDEPAAECRGTPSFIAPERLVPGARIDGRCDVYGLGATLYALLANGVPFQATETQEVVRRVRDEEPPPLPPSIPAGIATIVRTAMKKRPGDRFADCRDLARAIDRLTSRRRVSWKLGVVALVLAAGTGLFAGSFLRSDAPEMKRVRNPESAEAYLERGVAHCEAGRYEEAIRDLMTVQRLAPESKPKVEPFIYFAVSKLNEQRRAEKPD